MNPVENKKIEYWKSQLLDTGKRNKMINYRETARATLKIVEPGLDELYANYVQNENELTFEYPLDKDSDIRTYSVLRLFDRLSCPIPVLLGDIKVATSFQESKKTLKNLRNKSKLALEEQGTNILYLSFRKKVILWRISSLCQAVQLSIHINTLHLILQQPDLL